MSLIVKVWIKSLAYPSGEEWGKILVQIISTCLRYTQRMGGEGIRCLWYFPIMCITVSFNSEAKNIIKVIVFVSINYSYILFFTFYRLILK